MMTKKKGLILKVNKLSENDALFTVLLDDMKKITVISKGIRSLKHKDFAAMQAFCYNEFELKGNGGFFSVSSANIINNFYNMRTSVEKVSFASYFAEVAKVASEFLEGDNDYFRFLLNCLYFIENAEKKAVENNILTELKRIKIIFELITVSKAGFRPILNVCTKCGAVQNLDYFNIASGGLCCKKCSGEYSILVYDKLIRFFDFILNKDLKTVFNTAKIDTSLIDYASDISEKYLSGKLEYYFKSLDTLKKISYPENQIVNNI